MRDKKHIDRLFQERFKDFEATPTPAVWDKIEAKLIEKKKKRRVIPIWWRYAGVAALLLLLIAIGSINFRNDEVQPTPQVVDTENVTPESRKDIQSQNKTISNDLEPTISNAGNSEEQTDKHMKITQQNTEDRLKTIKQSSSIANTKDQKNKTENSSISTKSTTKDNSRPEVLFEENDKSKTIVGNRNTKDAEKIPKDDELGKSKVLINGKNTIDEKPSVVTSNNNLIKKEKTELIKDEKSTEIAGSTPVKEPRTIEEAIEKNTSLIEESAAETQHRWSVAPNVAPVYFSSLGKGSSIDAQFINNSKSGEVNMSYGINASYAINNRLTIRSGINKVNLGYNTNDVVVFRSVNATAANAKTLEALSGDTDNEAIPNSAIDTSSDITVISAETFNASNSFAAIESSNTTINQSFGYIEVPLEIQYALSSKRFGVSVIGGFSSLFLNNNDLSSNVEGQRIRLTEAENINKTSYSANFGLGLNYKVSKKIDLKLEPMFKYQINTFKNTSGDFQPFFIGVYSGFGIKF